MQSFYEAVVSDSSESTSEIESGHGLMGQSNAAGRMLSADLSPTYSELIGPMVVDGYTATILNKAINPDTYATMEAGVNTSDAVSKLGMQPKFAYEMLGYGNEDFKFIQCAYGGTPIELYQYGTANFTWFTDAVRDAKIDAASRGNEFVLKSLTWIQGESHGGDSTAVYAAKLRTLISNIRIYTGSPDLAFIIVQMIDCQTGVTGLSAIQAAQADVAGDDNVYLVSKSSGPDTCRDTLHFSDAKYVDVGYEVFEIVKDL